MSNTKPYRLWGWTSGNTTVYTDDGRLETGMPLYNSSGILLDEKVGRIMNVNTFNSLERFTITVSPDPVDATVVLVSPDGDVQSGNSITVYDGTRVEYTISKTGLITKTGTVLVESNQTLYVDLVSKIKDAGTTLDSNITEIDNMGSVADTSISKTEDAGTFLNRNS